ncbi:putative ATPase [Desulfitispora alkaliphila]|uniref:replication-associated recombination protein A n=1 Tax=Desulfitispora alkaliphila TaxID=622674 RepID=UPI003D24D1F3
MNLFEYNEQTNTQKKAPLATRMRPENLDEFEGQQKIVGPGTLLRNSIETDNLQSIILYGPPGTGKTTLAHIIAEVTQSKFKKINAVMAGVKDIREVVQEAKENLSFYGNRTIVFIDEIHRFNKSQQDALLPYVEEGLLTLIGATTENPMFSVNKALLSRSRIFSLEPLSNEQIDRLINRALKDRDRGLGNYNVEFSQEALSHIITMANGDARSALNALETAVMSTPPREDGVRRIDLKTAIDALQKPNVNYTKDGDEHYDVISAFIKSIRGSDPDGAVYWLARMIYAGEDLNFICRRLVISAAEDIGLADPQAIVVANSCAQAVERIGLPEGRIILAEATVYLALAPKSNSVYNSINKALAAIEGGMIGSVPLHLRDGSAGGKEKMGYGAEYLYPHNYDNHWVEQEYLPEEAKKQNFYNPVKQGKEKEMINNWALRTEKKI